MDINYLLARQQISLMNAASAESICARRAHEELAAAYGAKLSSYGFPVALGDELCADAVYPGIN